MKTTGSLSKKTSFSHFSEAHVLQFRKNKVGQRRKSAKFLVVLVHPSWAAALRIPMRPKLRNFIENERRYSGLKLWGLPCQSGSTSQTDTFIGHFDKVFRGYPISLNLFVVVFVDGFYE